MASRSTGAAVAGVGHRNQTPPHAKRHRHDVRQRVSPRRPPARPPGGGHRKTLLDHPAVCKNLKNPTRPSAPKDQAIRARCGVGLGWAGRLDAPGGNRREPKADEVEHGAVRSEGSGPQSEPRPPQAHAAPGVARTPTMTSLRAPRPATANPLQQSHSSPATITQLSAAEPFRHTSPAALLRPRISPSPESHLAHSSGTKRRQSECLRT